MKRRRNKVTWSEVSNELGVPDNLRGFSNDLVYEWATRPQGSVLLSEFAQDIEFDIVDYFQTSPNVIPMSALRNDVAPWIRSDPALVPLSSFGNDLLDMLRTHPVPLSALANDLLHDWALRPQAQVPLSGFLLDVARVLREAPEPVPLSLLYNDTPNVWTLHPQNEIDPAGFSNARGFAERDAAAVVGDQH